MLEPNPQVTTIVRIVYEQVFKSAFFELAPGIICSQDGFCTIATDHKVTAGFGVFRNLTPSTGLLSTIATHNQRNRVGHYWLAEGSDNDHWSLICGFKFLPNWESQETLITKLSNVTQSYPALLSAITEETKQFAGSPYWQPNKETDADTYALVLLSHLS